MARDDFQERTEQASPQRLREAAERGQVPRSRDLNTLGILLTAGAGLAVLGPGMAERMAGVIATALAPGTGQLGDPGLLAPALIDALLDALAVLAPLLALLMLAAALVPMALGGFNFSPKALKFDAEKLDPIKGLGRIFSLKALVELAKATAKFTFMGSVTGLWLWYAADDFMRLGMSAESNALLAAGAFVVTAFVIGVLPMVVIAAVDVPFQLWEHARQLRMTRREVKDEQKDTDGNPELKARIARQRQELAGRRMMAEVPDADVIVVNPVHFAVALRYDPNTMAAPVVVAKGVDHLASRIREIGRAHHVTEVRSPRLARALYFNVELERPIPGALFTTVARVLAYVFSLRAGNDDADLSDLQDLAVPAGLRTE